MMNTMSSYLNDIAFPSPKGNSENLVIATPVNTGMEPRKQTILACQLLSCDIPCKVRDDDFIIACSSF